MTLQTCMTFFLLWNNKYILKNVYVFFCPCNESQCAILDATDFYYYAQKQLKHSSKKIWNNMRLMTKHSNSGNEKQCCKFTHRQDTVAVIFSKIGTSNSSIESN